MESGPDAHVVAARLLLKGTMWDASSSSEDDDASVPVSTFDIEADALRLQKEFMADYGLPTETTLQEGDEELTSGNVAIANGVAPTDTTVEDASSEE